MCFLTDVNKDSCRQLGEEVKKHRMKLRKKKDKEKAVKREEEKDLNKKR